VYRADSEGNGSDGGATQSPSTVPSTVSLAATKIIGITPGVFASFSEEFTVGDDGSFAGQVLPGEYRVRVEPQAGRGLAAVETSLSVTCARDPNAPATCASLGSGVPTMTEAGKTLFVPTAATISGTIGVPYAHGQIDGATVQALPATFGKTACDRGDGGVDAGGYDAGCAVSKVSVLDIALGGDGFAPRAVSAPTTDSSFKLTEVDCGGCGKGMPAYFDISVRSQDGSRFPWLVDTGVAVGSDVDLGQLVLPLPIIQQGVVDILNGQEARPTPVPGALIRAYVLRNDLGAYIDDPEGMKSCTSVGSGPQQPNTRCIRSVLQVGETRAANDGSFELVLPSSVQ
jgi:hypothetical protein